MNYFVHSTSDISSNVLIGKGTKIWHFCHIRENVQIGVNCIFGKNVYIDKDVKIGNNCKFQNNCSIYSGAIVEDGVFIGPNCILTNDKKPRAVNPDMSLKTSNNWKKGSIIIRSGVALGAGTIVLPDVEIGEWALIGAGSLVTKNIPPFSLAYGNPAIIIGKVDKKGVTLERI